LYRVTRHIDTLRVETAFITVGTVTLIRIRGYSTIDN
jgi:hypothetical protein